MGKFFAFLLIFGLLSKIGQRIFVNSARDTGIVRFRGYIFLCFIFSLFLFFLGLLDVHRNSELWGYLSAFLFFIFLVLMLMRSQTSKSTKDRLRERMRDNMR